VFILSEKLKFLLLENCLLSEFNYKMMSNLYCASSTFCFALLVRKFFDFTNDTVETDTKFVGRTISLTLMCVAGAYLKEEREIPSFMLFIGGFLTAFIAYDVVKKMPRISFRSE